MKLQSLAQLLPQLLQDLRVRQGKNEKVKGNSSYEWRG
jgi:hypothetical protein